MPSIYQLKYGMSPGSRTSSSNSVMSQAPRNPNAEGRLVSNSQVRGDNDTSGNIFVSAGNAIHDFNNRIGTGIDNGFDNFVRNHFKDKDKAEKWANRYDGTDLALIPDIAEDIAIMAATGAWAPELGIGLLMAKSGLQNAENFQEAFTGVDNETGDKLSDKQRAAKGAGAALNTLIYAMPMPGGKLATKIASKTGVGKKIAEKNLADEAIKETETAIADTAKNIAETTAPAAPKIALGPQGTQEYIKKASENIQRQSIPAAVQRINTRNQGVRAAVKRIQQAIDNPNVTSLRDYYKAIGPSARNEALISNANIDIARSNARQRAIQLSKSEDGKELLYNTGKKRRADKKGFKAAVDTQQELIKQAQKETGITPAMVKADKLVNGAIKAGTYTSIPVFAASSGLLNAIGENGDNGYRVMLGQNIDGGNYDPYRSAAGAALAMMLFGRKASGSIGKMMSKQNSTMNAAVQRILENPENAKLWTKSQLAHEKARMAGWQNKNIIPASFIAATGNSTSDTRYVPYKNPTKQLSKNNGE